MAQKTLLTAEEFFREYGGKEGRYYELVKGEVVRMTPPGWEHGRIATNVVRIVDTYVRGHDLGVVVESGYRLERSPDTVRGPDVSFVRKERVAEGGKGFFPGAPDLAIEVVSPLDTAVEVAERVHDFLRTGAQQVWAFYPAGRRVQVTGRDGHARWHGEDDTLDGGDLLPGFSMPVREFFQ